MNELARSMSKKRSMSKTNALLKSFPKAPGQQPISKLLKPPPIVKSMEKEIRRQAQKDKKERERKIT